MPQPTRYLAGESTGTPFGVGITSNVIVTDELNTPVSGHEGDTVVYTATVKDDVGGTLPASFVASLKINETLVITDQVFDVAVYDDVTGLLTLSWTVPAPVGELTVKLVWAQQLIMP